MVASDFTCYSFWWVLPVLMMVLCVFAMRGGRGFRMCGFGPRDNHYRHHRGPGSALEILNKRYASGEISDEEYEEVKKTITESTDTEREAFNAGISERNR